MLSLFVVLICAQLSLALLSVQVWYGEYLAEQGIHLHLCLQLQGQCHLHNTKCKGRGLRVGCGWGEQAII